MPITCDAPTPHYSSGRALLEHYDTDNDGKLTLGDRDRAFTDMMDMAITEAEYNFVDSLFAFPGSDPRYGDINSKCPPVGLRPPPCGNYGDVDNDGYVTDTDADWIMEYVVELREFTADQKIRADVGGDGVVDINDARAIGRYAGGIIDTFPVCEPPPEVTITFVTKKEDATELTGVSVYINEIKKGET